MIKIVEKTIKVLVIISFILELIKGNITNIFLSIITYILFILTDILSKKINISYNSKILIYIFLYTSNILGEVYSLYAKISYFDLIAHFLSGIVISSIAFDIIIKEKIKKVLKIIFVLSIPLAVASLWEVTEFTIDRLLKKDMQKDTIINEITSVKFSLNNKDPITKKVDFVKVNHEDFTKDYGGYIDIGLFDTMEDIIMCTIGTIVFIIKEKRSFN